jgi:hypothetical protein
MAHNAKPDSESELDGAPIYEIRVMGRLDQQWSDWFDGMAISPDEEGATLITGPVVDDAALHGLLKKVRDAGLRLLSVNRADPTRGDRPGGADLDRPVWPSERVDRDLSPKEGEENE